MTVAWSFSKRKRIEDAIADLRCREGTTIANIGCVRLDTQFDEQNSPEEEILEWATKKKIDAVVWTALPSNFEKHGKAFSVETAVAHIKALDPNAKARAACLTASIEGGSDRREGTST